MNAELSPFSAAAYRPPPVNEIIRLLLSLVGVNVVLTICVADVPEESVLALPLPLASLA